MTHLLSVEELSVVYGSGRHARRAFRAVDGVTFQIAHGESVGLVGESGSGKTTIGRAILGLLPVAEGRVLLDGTDVTHVPAGQRGLLAGKVQAVFQDPYTSLNPARSVGRSLLEPLVAIRRPTPGQAEQRCGELLTRVGLDRESMERYPHQFSGGQRQRIAIARALAVGPDLVVCDEPVSALDVSTQAQVLNLLAELRQEAGLSYLFIGHDLAVVRYITQRVVVLYRGQVMEHGPTAEITSAPRHPYTQALVSAVPVPDVAVQQSRRRQRRDLLRPSGTGAAGKGCPFTARCPHAAAVCSARRPRPVAMTEVVVSCHRYDPGSDHPSPAHGPVAFR